ncbi:MAG: 30S ribosomal protein S5 [Candidatus Omnitrophota bacterium]
MNPNVMMKNSEENKEMVFIEKVISINRVTKVTKGGKNLGFSALVVVGDENSHLGYALGKANEVATAIKKGIHKARKDLITVKKKGTTIPHEAVGKFGAVKIFFKPASKGTGVVAASSIRAICECAGIKDILTKILKKSTNAINVVKATFNAFENFKG